MIEPMSAPAGVYQYRRHAPFVRICHWITVLAFFLLLASGLQIFNAHPSLYWGKSSFAGDAPLLSMRAARTQSGEQVGVTTVLGRDFETTGVFGLSSENGVLTARGFPSWMTVPGPRWLAMGRRWHFFFAWLFVVNGLVYVALAVWSRHVARDLLPRERDWRSIGHSIKDHLLLRHPQGEAARNYNVLQKLSYLVVIFGLLPLVVLLGLAMSPGLNAAWPGWVDIFGGRQSARTLHFVAAWLLVLFVLIHVFQVIVSGAWNNVRSMITGRYQIRIEGRADAE
jgi:thiosulfate reductase cytochrome b subunit